MRILKTALSTSIPSFLLVLMVQLTLSYEYPNSVMLISYLFVLINIFIPAFMLRKSHTFFSYGDALGISTLSIFILCILYALSNYFISKYIEGYNPLPTEVNLERDRDQANYNEIMNIVFHPVYSSIFMFFAYFIVGFFVSLITSLFLRKNYSQQNQ